MKNTE